MSKREEVSKMAHYMSLAESYFADAEPEEFCEACKMYVYDGECDC